MRTSAPPGHAIAEAASRGRLRKRLSVEGKHQGKKVRFTPAKIGRVESMEEVEKGQFVGRMENDAEGDESGLPPGQYNLFLTREKDRWHVYAEADGKVRGEAVRVEVERYKWGAHKVGKPQFREKGWCLIDICFVSVWGHCLIGIKILCF